MITETYTSLVFVKDKVFWNKRNIFPLKEGFVNKMFLDKTSMSLLVRFWETGPDLVKLRYSFTKPQSTNTM